MWSTAQQDEQDLPGGTCERRFNPQPIARVVVRYLCVRSSEETFANGNRFRPGCDGVRAGICSKL